MTNHKYENLEKKYNTSLEEAKQAKEKTLIHLCNWISASYEAKKCLNLLLNTYESGRGTTYKVPDNTKSILDAINVFVGRE
jgi:hypothetical protein